ncbi:MAG: helix-turn-helix transcriptional regulator [Ruminococcaceae bacterium]|nr:helix-turn-helix transcriptional regulator [Oscillospiraceae bacterium]
MSIGSTIKRLRLEKGMTQEQLAEFLGLSTNAISQWECDKTAPDISNLPVLANIFEVSADILLGIDLAKNKKQAEIEEFKEKYAKLHSQGKTEERVLLSRAMQKKYPNDETVRHHLMRALQNEDVDKYFEEIVSLGEQLLQSKKTEYRMGAIRGLCLTYLHKGDRKTALQYADMMPPAEDLHLHVLEGDELVMHCQNYFWKIFDKMYVYLLYLIDCPEAGYTFEEKHSMLKMLYDMIGMIFSDKDFGFFDDRLARISFFMAAQSAKAGKLERALDELEMLIAHLEKLQSFSQIEHTSLLVNKIKFSSDNITKHTEEPLGHFYWRHLNRVLADAYAPVKDSARYIAIKERLAAL